MFQNMGPQPSPLSGHAMASIGPRVFVLGGFGAQFINPAGPDDPTVHVLDTSSYFIHPLTLVSFSLILLLSRTRRGLHRTYYIPTFEQTFARDRPEWVQ